MRLFSRRIKTLLTCRILLTGYLRALMEETPTSRFDKYCSCTVFTEARIYSWHIESYGRRETEKNRRFVIWTIQAHQNFLFLFLHFFPSYLVGDKSSGSAKSYIPSPTVSIF